jgi:hypothetical protein
LAETSIRADAKGISIAIDTMNRVLRLWRQAAGSSGLRRTLAWVGITAGAVFIFAVIFFSGFLVSWTAGGHLSGHHMDSASMAACCHSGMSHHMMPGDHM